MIDVSKLPAVRAQLELDASTAKNDSAPQADAAPVEYARAPTGEGHIAALRPQGGQK
jgi:hypothetical protein